MSQHGSAKRRADSSAGGAGEEGRGGRSGEAGDDNAPVLSIDPLRNPDADTAFHDEDEKWKITRATRLLVILTVSMHVLEEASIAY